MTFTKEKLAELIDAANNTTWTLSEGGVHEYDDLKLLVDTAYAYIELVKAAAALPNYITALAEAERALEQYEVTLNEAADDYNKMEKVCLQHGLMSSHREAIETAAYIRAMLRGHSKALTTIRQLARGNTDE